MNRGINRRTGRVVFWTLVLSAGIVAILTLHWIGRGGAISPENRADATRRILEIYLPLLGIMAGFYFGQRTRPEGGVVRTEVFAFALSVVAVWSIAPIVVLYMTEFVEDAITLLQSLAPFGDLLATAAVAFYFSTQPARPTA